MKEKARTIGLKGGGIRSMSVWICKACATCDICDIEYCSNNAMGLMAKHCKKTGHTGEGTVCYGIGDE